MEIYARNDTHYLKPMADKLRQELEQKGRLSWHQESCARLIADSTRESPPDQDAVWRVKGSHLLSRPALAIVRELWEWRETEAIAANKPPFFVISHEALVDLAAAMVTHRPLDPLIPRHLSERRRLGLLKAIERGAAIAPEHYPKIPRSSGRRPTDGERRRFAELQRRRDDRAIRLGIDPTLIASRSMLSDLAHDWAKHETQLMSWQHGLLVV
jgi:ribonuclease D